MIPLQRRKEILLAFADAVETNDGRAFELSEEEELWLRRLNAYMARQWATDIASYEVLLGMGALPGAPDNDSHGWWADSMLEMRDRQRKRGTHVLDEYAREVLIRDFGGVRDERANVPQDRVGEFDN